MRLVAWTDTRGMGADWNIDDVPMWVWSGAVDFDSGGEAAVLTSAWSDSGHSDGSRWQWPAGDGTRTQGDLEFSYFWGLASVHTITYTLTTACGTATQTATVTLPSTPPSGSTFYPYPYAAAQPAAPCEVPSLVGLTLARARSKLAAACCALGRVTHRRARSHVGRVVAQRLAPGVAWPAGEAVAVVVGRR